jgi:hypothetical protein
MTRCSTTAASRGLEGGRLDVWGEDVSERLGVLGPDVRMGREVDEVGHETLGPGARPVEVAEGRDVGGGLDDLLEPDVAPDVGASASSAAPRSRTSTGNRTYEGSIRSSPPLNPPRSGSRAA